LAAETPVRAKPVEPGVAKALTSEPPRVSRWNGYERQDYTFSGRAVRLVKPRAAATGNPWLWRAEFPDSAPATDKALLAKGWHVAYYKVSNLYGAPVALDAMDGFYEHATNTLKLSPTPVLVGVSRGGLYAMNWTARHPDKVAAVYLDAPVCDFKSWPMGLWKGQRARNGKMEIMRSYGFKTEEELMAYTGNPVDNLAPVARHRVPIISVVGTADKVVPLEENTAVLEKRYRELGGEILVIRKEGVGHHPHGLENDPSPIVDFILKKTKERRANGAACK
jgi:pimeloyl-ACP methyl ester carboxylesterase